MQKILSQAIKEIGQYRAEITQKLLEFARTDVLFFWGEKKELFLRQEKEWLPILAWAEDLLKVKLNKTSDLKVPENEEMQNPLKKVFDEMSDTELACYYAAALNMRSVLLALAFVKGKLTAEKACELAYLEEVWQNEIWGEDEDALGRRQERCDELKEIESYLKAHR